MTSELSTFAARVRESIQSGFPVDDFGVLAPELFALQFANNPAYRGICEARCVTPLTVTHWSQIPAVPAAAFKELDLTCLSPADRTHVFHSSGTTGHRPSRHFHNAASLAVYETSLWSGFELNLRCANSDWRMLSLTPPAGEAPHSSLVHMFDFVRQKSGGEAGVFVGCLGDDGSWTVDFEAALAALALDDSRPLLVLGTAFAYVQLLEEMAARNARLHLPPGSLVLETGGYKGRSRALPKAELHALFSEWLGVTASQIVCEYGMSELSSQAYDTAKLKAEGQSPQSRRVFHFPPWARAQIISPETGREVGEGETGLLRVFDLANVFSVLAIQTEDLAVRCGAGFELIGRAQPAEPRGCSLMTAESRQA